MSYDPEATEDRNLPTCESCGKPFKYHLGLTGTCAELTAIRAELAAAKDVLQRLYDNQNGCPLPSYQEDWEAAMRDAGSILWPTE